MRYGVITCILAVSALISPGLANLSSADGSSSADYIESIFCITSGGNASQSTTYSVNDRVSVVTADGVAQASANYATADLLIASIDTQTPIESAVQGQWQLYE